MIDTSIFSIIIDKLYYMEKPCLIFLLKVDKKLEIGFYYIILPFNLAIYLWIKSGKKFSFDAKEIA